MKRIILWGSAITVVFLTTTLVVGYFYARAHLHEIPPLVQNALKEKGIDFRYQSAEVASSGLQISLKNLKVEGKELQYPVAAANASFGVRLALSSKPFIVGLRLDRPTIQKREERTPSNVPVSQPPTSPSHPPFFLGPALALMQFEVAITQADLPDFGVEGVTAAVRARGFKFGAEGLKGVRLTHDVLVEKITQLPYLPGVHTEGAVAYDDGTVGLTDSTVELGPFRIGLEGKVGLVTKDWNVALSLPETDMSSASKAISARAMGWLSKIAGKMGIEAKAVGHGFSTEDGFKLKEATGALTAKKLALTLQHPQAKGDMAVDGTVHFNVKETAQFDFNLKGDLTATEINQGEVFKKEKGIPLTFTATGNGKDKAVQVDSLALIFHNLSASGGGSVLATENPSGNLHLTITETSLEGWERFFPRYQNIKCKGKLGGQLTYNGPLKEWTASSIDANLKAQGMVFPLLAEWFDAKGLNVDGLAEVNSDTKLSLAAGALKQIQTSTQVDLGNAEVRYGELFEKKRSLPFQLKLEVTSKGKSAEVKQGLLRVGNLITLLGGSIQNLTAPSANLHFSVSPFAAEELRKMVPLLRKSVETTLGGQLSLKGKVTGPLTDKRAPLRYEAELLAKTLAFQYQLESKKKIEVRNISGPIRVTQAGLNVNHLIFQTPGSAAVIDVQVASFDRANVKFSLKSDRFRLADFYETEEKKQAVGFTVIPTAGKAAGTTTKVEDFRKNPWLKKVTLAGDVSLKNADLGQLKSPLVTARIAYENLLLKVDPFVVKAFEGTVTTNTVWDGRKPVPVSTVAMKADAVDANQFLANWSDKAKDILSGRLNTSMQMNFAGMSAEELKKSAEGQGSFTLNDGEIKSVKLTEKPLEALRKIPGLQNLNPGGLNEKLNQINGTFVVKDTKMHFSDLIIRNAQFDAQSMETAVDFDMNLSARLMWYPKESLVGGSTYELLKDDSGRASLPLTLGGTVTSPSVSVDNKVAAERIQQAAARKLTNEAKKQLQGEVEKKLKEGLQGLFK